MLQDGNGAIYPLAKNCIQGVRDPQWLDLLPVHCMNIGVQNLPHVEPPSKNRVAVIALALDVRFRLFHSDSKPCSSPCILPKKRMMLKIFEKNI